MIRDLAVGISSLKSAARGAPRRLAPRRHRAMRAPILVASPWPARTSIACRCAALPLPPAAKDPESQLAMMRGVSYVILADSLDSRPLANNFSQLGARVEVVSKQPGGVILR